MDRRYQVFISSTFTDLIQERQQVMNAVMKLNCIPAGMELFSAVGEEQFKFITRIIDDSDYYILILGGRYGSLCGEDGIGYTEKEFDYAIEKGIKIMALLHRDPKQLTVEKSDTDPVLKEKYDDFRNKVLNSGLIADFWDTPTDLPGLVMSALSTTIRIYPAEGWIRANTITNPEAFQELNEVRKELDILRRRNEELESLSDENDIYLKYSWLTEEVLISGDYTEPQNVTKKIGWHYTEKWDEIMYYVLNGILEPTDKYAFKKYLNINLFFKLWEGSNDKRIPEIHPPTFDKIKLRLLGCNLMEIKERQKTSTGKSIYYTNNIDEFGTYYLITKNGASLLMKLMDKWGK